MNQSANWPLDARLSQSETQAGPTAFDTADLSTRERLLAEKRAQQRAYIDRDGAGEEVEVSGQRCSFWVQKLFTGVPPVLSKVGRWAGTRLQSLELKFKARLEPISCFRC